MSKKPNKHKEQQPVQTLRDPGGISWAILGILVAPAGFILWFLWREKRPKTASMCLRGAGVALLIMVINLIVMKLGI